MTKQAAGLIARSIMLLLLGLACITGAQADASWPALAAQHLEKLLDANPHHLRELRQPAVVEFYRKRGYGMLWSDESGRLNRAYDLLHVILAAQDDGLEPYDYFLVKIRKLWDSNGPEESVRLDLLLTAALYRYSNDVYSGMLDPHEVDPDWHIDNSQLDIGSLLEKVAGNTSIAVILGSLPPDHAGYRLLKQQLRRYRDIARQGGWRKLKPGPVLEFDVQSNLVLQLKRRLRLSGDLVEDPFPDSDYFDSWLEQAVKHYQARHGLDVDGRVGPQTRRSLNVSVEDRIMKIRINMERWRWLPRDLGRRYLVVNMTGFELYIMKDDAVELSMPVIIGKAYRSTPTFTGVVSYMEYNPYWTIPRRMAWEKFIPRQMRDPSYLENRSIRVFKGWAEAEETDPRTVDWNLLDWKSSPYWMRQDPGPRNALGRIKFIFSNPYQIYLHGTPDKYLFNRSVRTFSSGCIRVKDPVKLAAFLLNDGSRQKEEEVQKKILLGTNQKVTLPVAVPIYLLYWTAWAGEDGSMNFRNDIYGRDTLLNLLFAH